MKCCLLGLGFLEHEMDSGASGSVLVGVPLGIRKHCVQDCQGKQVRARASTQDVRLHLFLDMQDADAELV